VSGAHEATAALVRVPVPMLLEAPSSWLSRVALHQGATFDELCAYLGLSTSPCVDLAFLDLDLARLQAIVNVPIDGLQEALRVLRSIEAIDTRGKHFLLRDRSADWFRYCPHCLREQREAFVPIHWRVSSWRYCFEHSCLMVSGCAHCGAATSLPLSMINAGPQSGGIAYLSQCARCGRALSQREALKISQGDSAAMGANTWCLLRNGRATLAALYSATAYGRLGGPDLGLQGVVRFAKCGAIPWPGWLPVVRPEKESTKNLQGDIRCRY
jgi:hypothetical protein